MIDGPCLNELQPHRNTQATRGGTTDTHVFSFFLVAQTLAAVCTGCTFFLFFQQKMLRICFHPSCRITAVPAVSLDLILFPLCLVLGLDKHRGTTISVGICCSAPPRPRARRSSFSYPSSKLRKETSSAERRVRSLVRTLPNWTQSCWQQRSKNAGAKH